MWIYWRVSEGKGGGVGFAYVVGYVVGTERVAQEHFDELSEAQELVHYLNGGQA